MMLFLMIFVRLMFHLVHEQYLKNLYKCIVRIYIFMLLSLNKSHVEREKGNSDFQLLHDKYM